MVKSPTKLRILGKHVYCNMKIWDFASDILDFKQQTCGGKNRSNGEGKAADMEVSRS